MNDASELIRQFVEQYKYPVVIADLDHIIRYLNKAACDKYAKRGFPDLENSSLLDCHNANSVQMIKDIVAKMKDGLDEVYLATTKENQKVFMTSIRNERGELIGYSERFEDIHDNTPPAAADY